MSINRIKEIRNAKAYSSDNDIQISRIMEYLNELASYLIEQEEQKVKFVPSDSGDPVADEEQKEPEYGASPFVKFLNKQSDEAMKELREMPGVNDAALGSNPVVEEGQKPFEMSEIMKEQYKEEQELMETLVGVNVSCLGDPVVEVGQIRTWNKKYEWGRTFEVVGVVSDMVKTQYAEEKGTRTFNLKEIKAHTELITMDNIKVGEWVKCYDNRGFGNWFNIDTKYKITELYDRAYAEINARTIPMCDVETCFKPCLPPKEEKESIECNCKLLNFDNIDFSDFRYKTDDPVVEVGQMFIVENGDLKPLGIFTQEDLDKAVKEAEGRCMAEGFRQGFDEAVNTSETRYTKFELDNEVFKAREEGDKQGFKEVKRIILDVLTQPGGIMPIHSANKYHVMGFHEGYRNVTNSIMKALD